MTPPTEKPNILIVDDNPENILVIQKILSRIDANILTATSGNDALFETLYNDFAVIFLDVQMPGMDGYEVAELLKSDEKTAGIPIIFVTAVDRENTKEIKGYDKGAVDFLFKPFNEAILLSKTKVFLDIYRLKTELEELVTEKICELKESNRQLTKEIARKEIVEQELIKTRSYLSSIINSISSILIGTDTRGMIINMNTKAAEVSGISAQNAMGKSIAEVFPFFADITLELIASISNNEPVEKNNCPITISDTVTINNFAVYPLIGEDIDQVVIRVDDVTQEKKMAEELQQRRHIDSLGQLAGGIAHDFNNMLSAIMGGAELLRIKAGETSHFTKHIDSILTAAERAADLTSKLLSFARKKKTARTTIDMHLLIRDTAAILQRSIDKRITIEIQENAVNSMVLGDDSELSSALLNLGINARDAMPEGGVLTISTLNQKKSLQTMTAGLPPPEKQYLEVSVSDTGIGMSAKVQSMAFEPFFTTKEQGKGTGLGLASVYGTIKAHSGTIKLESAQGNGSSFTLLLPSSQQTIAPAEIVPKAISEQTVTGTVLVVDDEESLRDIASDLLAELGMKVITAENGRKAVDMVAKRKQEISLILLDMIMPELNGRDCYQEIKKIMPDAKVVICTGYAPREMMSELLEEGVLDVIRKPFRLSELKKVVHSCLANS